MTGSVYTLYFLCGGLCFIFVHNIYLYIYKTLCTIQLEAPVGCTSVKIGLSDECNIFRFCAGQMQAEEERITLRDLFVSGQ